MNKPPVITIDGPSGSGKGTIASRVAESLGFSLLDSGALYRVLGIACDRYGVDLSIPSAVANLARELDIHFGISGEGSVWLDGEDVSLAIRTDLGKRGSVPTATGLSGRPGSGRRRQGYGDHCIP